jgi:SAM-dependent methyltransferase
MEGAMEDRPAADYWTAANISTWDERAGIHLRDTTDFYGVKRFRAGEDVILPIESSDIGQVAGKHLLHLQCHIGLDALCLARRGAIVTGLDFSPRSIAVARLLATGAGLKAGFVQADVYESWRVLKGGFDIIYVNWGSLNWLPNVWKWADIVAGLLAPGGYLYLIEQHPAISTMREREGRIEPGFAWRTPVDRPAPYEATTSYNNDGEKLANTRMYEWEHPLSDVIGGLLAAGLHLDFFHEHEVLPWRRLPMMVPAGNRMYRLPDNQVPMPLSYSLKATKYRR